MSYAPRTLDALCFNEGDGAKLPPSMFAKLVLLREDRAPRPPFPYPKQGGVKPPGVLRAAVAARAKGRGR